MKKLLLLIVMLTAWLTPSLAFAQSSVINSDICPPESAICKDINSTSGSDDSELFGSSGLVTRIVQFITIITGLIAVFMMIYAGFMYITSGGDSKRTSTAKTTIIYGAIGLVIALMSQSIVSFILVNIK